MRRDRATEVVEGLLAAICAREPGSALDMVVGVDVFGSYARGASQPGDVDLNIELDYDRILARYHVYEYMRRRHEIAVKKALVGGARSVNLIFQARRYPDSYPYAFMVLWNEGDQLAMAQDRLHAVVEDPAAGRAPRDHMLPAFEGLEKWLPIYLREHMCRAVGFGAITVEPVIVADARITEPVLAERLDDRWRPGGAANRLGHALLANFRDRDIDPATVHLQGRDVGEREPAYYAGFGCQALNQLPYCFAVRGAREHVEVPPWCHEGRAFARHSDHGGRHRPILRARRRCLESRLSDGRHDPNRQSQAMRPGGGRYWSRLTVVMVGAPVA